MFEYLGLAYTVIFWFLSIVTFITSLYLLSRVIQGNPLYKNVNGFFYIAETTALVILPCHFFYNACSTPQNYCFHDTSVLSPDHRLSIFVLSGLVCLACYYSRYRKRLAPPLPEVLINCLLISGIALLVLIEWDEGSGDWYMNIILYLLTGFPTLMYLLLALMKNHRLALDELDPSKPLPGWLDCCRRLLLAPPLTKYPLLILLCLPVLVLLALILLLFGQKPDSMIRAFTDTYQQRFSTLTLPCPDQPDPPESGHYLCTIAAKGHPALVRPVRPGIRRVGAGIRGAGVITCNRQLLISNAFEELLERRTPWLHGPVRRLYNQVGKRIHRHYWIFNNPWISDLIYALMKPLEWLFLLALYTCCRKPENWIARQYLAPEDKSGLTQLLP